MQNHHCAGCTSANTTQVCKQGITVILEHNMCIKNTMIPKMLVGN